MKEVLKKIGQLQYEISCLELDKETLTGVTIRTEELKELVKNFPTPDIVGQSKHFCFCGAKQKISCSDNRSYRVCENGHEE